MEINLGQPIPTYERPDRAETIRQQLETDERFSFVGLKEHGRAPIEAVHALGLIDYLEKANAKTNKGIKYWEERYKNASGNMGKWYCQIRINRLKKKLKHYENKS